MLIVIGFGLYAFNFHNSLFWDDDDWIVNNLSVHQFSWTNLKFIFSHDALAAIGLRSNYYRPFLFFTFLLNYIISGDQPFSYHLINNSLHIANAVIIFLLIDAYLKKRLAATITALIFLIHPLQTEAVTYISGRGDPMLVFFMLLALVSFLFAVGLWPEMKKPRFSLIYWGLSIFFLILAILSRETAFLFPVYLAIFLMAFVSKDKFWPSFKKSIIKSWPYFLVSLMYGISRLTILNFQNTLNFYQQANIYANNLSYRIYTFLHVLVIYFKLIFIPTGLHMDREVLINTSLLQIEVWPSVLILLLILYLVIRDFNKTRLWFFAWGIFFVNLAPTSGIFPINGLLYEHWLYFSIFGLAVLVGYYLDKIFDILKSNKKVFASRILIVILVIYGSFLCFQSVKRNIIWGKPIEFYESIIKYEPTSVRGLTNLATIYLDEGNIAQAKELLQKAVDIGDIQPQPYYDLANILRDQGDIAGAIALYKKSIEVSNHFPYAYQNLAIVYAKQGNLKEALASLEKLSELIPSSPEVWYNIGLINAAMGNRQAALESGQKALALLKKDSELYTEIQKFLQSLGKK